MKKFLIVFPSEWLAYSPTVLNMISILEEQGHVDVVTFKSSMSDIGECSIQVHFIHVLPLLFRILSRLRLIEFYKFILLLWTLRLYCKNHYDIVWGIDSLGYLTAKIFYKKVTFVSLEVKKDIWAWIVRKVGLSKLLIQSHLRKEYLFGKDFVLEEYILPNSPILYTQKNTIEKKILRKVIYMGNICRAHGVEFCIDALREVEQEISLTLHGILQKDYRLFLIAKYKDLMQTNRLFLTSEYVSQDHIISYLQTFDIGLCLYDMWQTLKSDFNYLTCPSGKMYNYFASGLPVIGNDIPGLQDIRTFGAGILVDNFYPKTIASAINSIYREYNAYSMHSFQAAHHFDFKAHFLSILNKLDFRV
jgi:glycosyltransferase involved in cell wall biosynthesis